MRAIVTTCFVAASVFWGAAGRVHADLKAELASTVLVWDGANHVANPDLIRHGDRWLLACQESNWEGYPGGAVRILTSADGKAWESAALIESPTPKRGLFAPTFAPMPDGRLAVSAVGTLPYPDSQGPLPEYGGMLKTLAWVSENGQTWGKPEPRGLNDFPLDRVVWHKGTTFAPAIGRICGSAQTIQLMASQDGMEFESRYEETVQAFMPYEGALLFENDTAYWLVTGYSQEGPISRLGTSKSPYEKWAWKDLNQRIRNARFLPLPDKRVIATAWMLKPAPRTSVCEFNPGTGVFTELLALTPAK